MHAFSISLDCPSAPCCAGSAAALTGHAARPSRAGARAALGRAPGAGARLRAEPAAQAPLQPGKVRVRGLPVGQRVLSVGNGAVPARRAATHRLPAVHGPRKRRARPPAAIRRLPVRRQQRLACAPRSARARARAPRAQPRQQAARRARARVRVVGRGAAPAQPPREEREQRQRGREDGEQAEAEAGRRGVAAQAERRAAAQRRRRRRLRLPRARALGGSGAAGRQDWC